MHTVVETLLFQRLWPLYFTRNAEGEVVLLTLYAKSKTDNLTGPKLKEIRRVLEE